jgi:kynureninase
VSIHPPATPAAPRALADYRDEFGVVQRKTYLISASLGPVSGRSKAYLDDYVRAWETMGAPEPVWFDYIFPGIARLKEQIGQLIGAQLRQLAVMLNVSHSISSVASALDFSGERNRVILSELDFPTEGHIWLAQRRRGAEVVFLPSRDGLTVPVEDYVDAIDERTALVCLNRVFYRSSALLDVAPICDAARAAGALSLIDDYHGAGTVPIDVEAIGCDLYTAGALKWLCGGPGLSFLYARDDVLARLEPAVTGWWGQVDPFHFRLQELEYHPTARRFELGTHAAPAAFIAQGGLEIVLEVGMERIRARQSQLGDYVIERADAAGLAVRSPRDRRQRGGSVNVQVGPGAVELAERLYARDVCVDARGDGIRVAPHFFNTEADVDRCFDVLAELR